MIAFVPARAGSKRIPNKNLSTVGGVSLVVRAISTAQAAGASMVVVSSDSREILELSESAGAIGLLRPSNFAQDTSQDIEWVLHALSADSKFSQETFGIVRPTSPFLRPESIRTAHEILLGSEADSIRAIRQATEHPGKMWQRGQSGEILPLLPQIVGETPTHSRPTQRLGEVFIQAGAFEIARTESVVRTRTISGSVILGYELREPESLDVNSEQDLETAKRLGDLE